MNAYEVGKCYPWAVRQESTVFDLADDGAYLNVYFYGPKDSEVEQFKSDKPFEFRYVVLNDVIMCLFHIGNLNWMDAPYTPHLSKNLTRFVLPGSDEGLSLTVCLFDCNTGELKHIRYLSLNSIFTRNFFRESVRLKEKPFSEYGFSAALSSIYVKYSTKELLKLSSPGFKVY